MEEMMSEREGEKREGERKRERVRRGVGVDGHGKSGEHRRHNRGEVYIHTEKHLSLCLVYGMGQYNSLAHTTLK